jgi:hypothetical protein
LRRLATDGGEADFTSSSNPGSLKLHTFVPKRPEIGTWKSNDEKKKGKVVKSQCTFDRLMSKYKQKMPIL